MLKQGIEIRSTQAVPEGRHGAAAFLRYLTQFLGRSFGSLQISHSGHAGMDGDVALTVAGGAVAVDAVDGE